MVSMEYVNLRTKFSNQSFGGGGDPNLNLILLVLVPTPLVVEGGVQTSLLPVRTIQQVYNYSMLTACIPSTYIYKYKGETPRHQSRVRPVYILHAMLALLAWLAMLA